MLGRLAELYDCSAADLLADYADFRHRDPAHSVRYQLACLPAISRGAAANGDQQQYGPSLLAVAADSREEMDIHDYGTRPVAAPVEGGSRLAGIWHSRYVYQSSGRGAEFAGEHYLVLRNQNGRLVGQSLPHSMDSSLRLDLSVDGSVGTGTWSERTSPAGYYKGATYHGTVQLLIDPMGRNMSGKWVGFGKNFRVNDGEWELNWAEGLTSKRAMRVYHLKV